MKTIFAVALVLALASSGCKLTTGQFQIEFELNNVNVQADDVEAKYIDLNGRSVYDDHKDQLQGLADVALLGRATNNGASAIMVEAWFTPTQTNYTTDTEVRANATKVWGPFALPAGQTTTLDWDQSAALFSSTGKAALLDEIQGDGAFTIYIIGAAGTYNFTINNGLAVFIIDAGV